MDGLINVLKPPGITSHDLVLYLRKLFNTQKIGHTGTLDPGAAGVLPVCIGQGTRVAEYLMDKSKRYRGEMIIGIRTETYDTGGEITHKSAPVRVEPKQIEDIFQSLTGEIKQVPPMVSAVHYQGKRLYDLARQGKIVERKPRKVFIYSLKVLRIKNHDPHPSILFDIICSKGTYVRSICAEVGERLGFGACLSFLIRTESGPFRLENAFTLEEIKELWDKEDSTFLLPIDYALQDLPAFTVKEQAIRNIVNGLPLTPSGIMGGIGNTNLPLLVRLYAPNGIFLALGEYQSHLGGRWLYKPKKVFRFWQQQNYPLEGVHADEGD
ncbi:MAG: tRNA pseudouridine(55) synthase TruB [Bacillota bacterium]|nr:tRNA pseudouridine(55) synthase TruB [Bacillota bacterium]